MSTTSFEGPMIYDPNSENEIPVPLPCEPRIQLAPNVLIQPPLSRRGFGPGLVLLLPDIPPAPPIGEETPTTEQIDPEPVQKWAEEGYTILAIYATKGVEGEWGLQEALREGKKGMGAWEDKNDGEVVRGKYGMIG
jgi:carboxymethylenebutenolidase